MKAIITGITGQDGSYLAEFLLSRGYEVHGTVRHSSGDQFERISHIIDRLHIHQADLLDQLSIIHLIEEIKPDEVYNLAAYSSPAGGWHQPITCSLLNAQVVIRILEAIRMIDLKIRFFQASTAAMFGQPAESPQNEQTPFYPDSPYGAAKLYAHWTTVNYRNRYGIKTCSGILFDHESPRRSLEFVTRRITHAVARIKLGLQEKLVLDTLDINRDWGFAGDYVRAFWMMLQQPIPDDYAIASGKTHSLEDFCRTAFAAANLDWRDYVVIENPFNRPIKAYPLRGDTSRARRKLLWEPEISFEETVKMMVEADMARHSFTNRLRADLEREEKQRWSLSRQGMKTK